MGNYNEFAKEYENLTEKVERKTRNHFYDLIGNELEGKKVLDVGCGQGTDARYYSSLGAEVCGIDISEEQIKLAKDKVDGDFRVATMNELPFENGSFDFVTSFYALQASENVPLALNEMVRIAKKGGLISIIAKSPIRNLIEGHVNDENSDYFAKRDVTSYIFDREIKLNEPGHTMGEYINPVILSKTELINFEEHSDYPASEQLLEMKYPTYMILQYRKK